MLKKLKMLLIIGCLFLCFGCMNAKVKTNINKDKSVDVSFNIEIDLIKMYTNLISTGTVESSFCEVSCESSKNTDNYVECLNNCFDKPNISEEDIKKALDENMSSDDFNFDDALDEETIKKYEDLGYKKTSNFNKKNYTYTYTLSKHYANIDDITTTQKDPLDLNAFLNGESDAKYLFIKENDNYQASYTIDMESVNNEITMENELDNLKEFITYTYEVNLPNKALSSNATKKSSNDQTLTWDLLTTSNINYEFNFNSPKLLASNASKYIAYGLIVFGFILLSITLIIYKRKKS